MPCLIKACWEALQTNSPCMCPPPCARSMLVAYVTHSIWSARPPSPTSSSSRTSPAVSPTLTVGAPTISTMSSTARRDKHKHHDCKHNTIGQPQAQRDRTTASTTRWDDCELDTAGRLRASSVALHQCLLLSVVLGCCLSLQIAVCCLCSMGVFLYIYASMGINPSQEMSIAVVELWN